MGKVWVSKLQDAGKCRECAFLHRRGPKALRSVPPSRPTSPSSPASPGAVDTCLDVLWHRCAGCADIAKVLVRIACIRHARTADRANYIRRPPSSKQCCTPTRQPGCRLNEQGRP